MKRLLLALGLFSGLAVNAQNFNCGTDNAMRKLREENPAILQKEADLEAFTEWFIANHNNFDRDSNSHYIVPVVFHVLHDGDILRSGDASAHLDDRHILMEMQNMNEFWSATAPELGIPGFKRINPDFRAIVADMNIEFRLARRDPEGNPTNGIDRIYTYATHIGNNNSKLNPWPRDKYLNIWVCKAIEQDETDYGTLAYSMYPSGVDGQAVSNQIDGIISKAVCVGVNPASAHNAPNTFCNFARPCIAHEAGHWLNLKHPWGDTNQPGVACGDDDVDDTPITTGQQNSGACDSTVRDASCDTVPNGSPNTNVQNCMNYSNHHVMFTLGQKWRARAALEGTLAQRNNIWTDSNLAATGVEPWDTATLPAPKAQFGYSTRFAFVGQSVKVIDYTYNTTEWDRQWTFPDDATVSGTDSVRNVIFTAPGWKTISLTSSNASGSSTKTKTAIYVAPNASTSIPYPFFEGFNNVSNANEWTAISYDNYADSNKTFFTYNPSVGHHGNGCFFLNSYYTTYQGDRDELVSPAFDFTGVSNADFRFSFDYTMATRFQSAITNNDSSASLDVYITSGTTGNWVKINNATIIGGRKLYSAGGALNAFFTPGSDDQWWKTVVVDLSNGYNTYKVSNVRFKFVVNSTKYANNFYLDNFNVGNAEVTGINHIANIAAINLYPNPTADATTLLIEPLQSSHFTVEVFDMLGHKVMNVFEGNISSEKEISINTSSLPQGVYSVLVSADGKSQQQKLVKL